jgi:hypothetical protein
MNTATRTIYALFGAGLHGCNGSNPNISRKIWSTYVLPRMLHGAELWQLTGTQLDRLELFQRDKLKQLQGLPPRTADIATLGLIGVFPIEAVIHKKALMLFRSLIEDRSGIEYEICLRQLALKQPDTRSWTGYIQPILKMYGLPSAFSLILNTPGKIKWKLTVKSAIETYWEDVFISKGTAKSSLRFLSKDTLSPKKPALLWSSCQDSLRDTEKAFIKARFMTGTYKLQVHEAMFNQHSVNPNCLLCHAEPETRMHCLILCPALESARRPTLSQLRSILAHINFDFNSENLLQIILDCTHSSLPAEITENLHISSLVENLSRELIFKIHIERGKLLHLSAPVRHRGTRLRSTPRNSYTKTSTTLDLSSGASTEEEIP